MDLLEQALRELSLPPPVRRLYKLLAESGPLTPRSVAERLSVPRPSVYDHFKQLKESGVGTLLDRDGKKHFAVAPIDDLVRLVKEKEARVGRLAKELSLERERYATRIESIDPKIRFFEGKEGLKRLFGDFLWSGSTEIMSVWPYDEMLRVFGEETLEETNRRRIKHKISLRTVWTDRPGKSERIWKGGDFKVERRFAPRGFHPKMAYTIYGDRVSFVSSQNELYGFIVHSRDFAMLQAEQFELLWRASKGA